jgi:dinuclear metal center YbgI/SA1388 family protein
MKKRTSKPTASAGEVLRIVEDIAPPHLAEKWDNVGMQTGSANAPAGKILVCLEVSSAVIAEAKKRRVGTIVAHHPLIFRERKTFAEIDPVSRIANAMIRANINFIAAHTNLDSVADGTNGVLADKLGLLPERCFLNPAPVRGGDVKFAVFVPQSHADKIVDAIARGGGGVIGKYSHCSFHTPGTGTFKAGDHAKPYSGTGKGIDRVEEVRIECVCPRASLSTLIASVRAVHPYEEMAYDVYALEPNPAPKHGLGLVGKLAKREALGQIVKRMRRRIPGAQITVVGDPKKMIETVSLCSGAGGEFIRSGNFGKAQLFVTGEMSHHDAWEARERGVAVLLVGHFESEVIVCDSFAKSIREGLASRGWTNEVVVSEAQSSPISTP